MANEKSKRDFSNFRMRVSRSSRRAPLNDRAYTRWGYRNGYSVAADDFTLEEIQTIIRSGDLKSLRELSLYYYRTNGEYRNNIDFLASLPLYDTVVIPVMEEGKGSRAQILKSFNNACCFIEQLDIPNTFTHITKEWLKTGIYNGILRYDNGNAVIQDLPLEFCRTRFKDFNNLNILEFNLQYFDSIHDKILQQEAVESFPEIVQEAWAEYIAGKRMDPWVLLPAGTGGVCFTFSGDQTPLLIASIPELKKMDDAVKREEKRDESALYKLLIEKMPINSDGELVFQLEEVADIHASVADMLSDVDTVDVLTTFGDTDLESLQDTSAASQSNDRIAKYRTNAYDALGRSSLIFNADGSSSLAYSIKKDEALMISYLNVYETWIKFHLNDKFSRTGLDFDFEILPTTVFNRQDVQQSYFRAAQYGYSKMFAGVAMGIKQRDQISLMDFENDFLNMATKMVPLQSSYTTSGNAIASESEKTKSGGEKTTVNVQSENLDNKGGRPELPDEQKSEKTQANIAAAG